MNTNEPYRVEPYGRDCLGNVSGYCVIENATGTVKDVFPANLYVEGSFEAAKEQAEISAGLLRPTTVCDACLTAEKEIK